MRVFGFLRMHFTYETGVHAHSVRPPRGVGPGSVRVIPKVGLLLKPCFGGAVRVFFTLT